MNEVPLHSTHHVDHQELGSLGLLRQRLLGAPHSGWSHFEATQLVPLVDTY